jgi:hypothetical protein
MVFQAQESVFLRESRQVHPVQAFAAIAEDQTVVAEVRVFSGRPHAGCAGPAGSTPLSGFCSAYYACVGGVRYSNRGDSAASGLRIG